ncbi:MAG: hypothetical protein Q8R55_03905 [Candidatus Taylorbacteria bacterium]|nr:hypothetical protein [Candidatus Taylorbacteria bacterium]
MNKFLSKITPEWALRGGLGVMYIYSGIDILRHPTAWFWAVRPILKWFPASMQASLGQPDFMKKFLLSQGVVEVVFAVVLLAWFLPKKYSKWVAALTTLEMAGILFVIPIDAVTFRDFGLLGAGLALFLILRGDSYIKVKPSIEKSSSFPKPEIRLGGEPLVQTFDEFIGKDK